MRNTIVSLSILGLALVAPGVVTQAADKPKYATEMPAGITAPAEVKTRLGTLKTKDGFPDQATIEKVYDNLDFQRGVQAVLTAIPAASLVAIRRGLLEFGPENQTVVMFEELMDSKSLFLTANTTTIYNWMWLSTKDGPLVLEAPPRVLGLIDNFWFRWVGDIGETGPDKGKGGKYLLLPPGYKGTVPEGYFVLRSPTYNNFFLFRGFMVDGSTGPAVEDVKKQFLKQKGVRNLDARTYFFFYATCITPAMAMKMVGKGSAYAAAFVDANGDPLDGSKTYKIHLPPKIPAKRFWSVTLYDSQSRSMLQTDQQFPAVGSLTKGMVVNTDTSVDVYFGPKAPAGEENNWVQTMPGEGYSVLFRLYAPLEPWYDKSWRPGEIELVK